MWRNFRFQCMTDVEKFEISPHAEEFQLFPHNRCGKMWNFAKFGGILHISTWQMWRNPKFTLFCCCKICFVTNYAVFAKSVLARFTCFCVEKNWAKNWTGGEKMTNMRCGTVWRVCGPNLKAQVRGCQKPKRKTREWWMCVDSLGDQINTELRNNRAPLELEWEDARSQFTSKSISKL